MLGMFSMTEMLAVLVIGAILPAAVIIGGAVVIYRAVRKSRP